MNVPEKFITRPTDVVLVGDIHGNFKQIIKTAHKHKNQLVIQIGDFGIGFSKNPKPKFPENLRFIRGNHDDPAKCQINPHYLGDFGFIPELDLFYVSGAWSIDEAKRVEGVDWWRDEQLNARQMNEAFDLYAKTKPKFVVSHDCPLFLYQEMNYTNKPMIQGGDYSTPKFLESMWNYHRPAMWLYGHHHHYFTKNVKGTRFICLAATDKNSVSKEIVRMK